MEAKAVGRVLKVCVGPGGRGRRGHCGKLECLPPWWLCHHSPLGPWVAAGRAVCLNKDGDVAHLISIAG